MGFQGKESTTLSNLSRTLFKSHLVASIVSFVLLVCSFSLIPVFINQQMSKKSPQFIIPHLLSQYYKQCFQHIQFLGQLANQIALLDIGEAHNDIGFYGAFAEPNQYINSYRCVYGSSEACSSSNFIPLAAVSWQYENNKQLKQMIENIIICHKTVLACISSKNYESGLKTQQLSILKQFMNRSIPPLQNIRALQIGQIPYILHVKQTIITLTKLKIVRKVVDIISSTVSLSYLSYFKIEVIYPGTHQVIQYLQNNQNISQPQKYNLAVYFSEAAIENNLSGPKAKGLELEVEFVVIDESIGYESRLTCFVSVIYLIHIFRVQKNRISEWVHNSFHRKRLINKLFKYSIRDIFSCTKPTISCVLQRGPSSQLFKYLSQLLDQTLIPVPEQIIIPTHRQPFKFIQKVAEIIATYKQQIKNVMVSKNKYILANRFNIQNYINDICEAEVKALNQFHLRAQQLSIERQFFKFAYFAILKSKQQYLNFIQDDNSPLPQKLLDYFQATNETIHQASLILDKFDIFPNNEMTPLSPSPELQKNLASHPSEQSWNYIQQNRQQLELRIRVYIIPKYLAILKELDSSNLAAQLGLEKQIKGLSDILQNTRLLLGKHNKSIRGFAK